MPPETVSIKTSAQMGAISMDPRKSSLAVLNQMETEGKTLDQILETFLDSRSDAPRRDKTLLYSIVYGVIRWRTRLDWVISRFSKTKLQKIDPLVLNILRIGLFQILYLDRIPVSAAVNTAVEMAKSQSAPWVVPYVNGVLRNAARGIATVAWPESNQDPIRFLAVTRSFPEWLVRRWLKRFGEHDTRLLCDAFNQIPFVTLRTNTLKTDRETLVADLSGSCHEMRLTDFSPDGMALSALKTSVDQMDGFSKGMFAVQDEAAQAVTFLLHPQPGEKVLDACCGLGGKTGHMGQLMKNTGTIFAVDKIGHKLETLEKEMHRLGITIVSTRNLDLVAGPDRLDFPAFDKILLDAPCSGLGVIRRNPDTKWRVTADKIKRLAKTQTTLLNRLAPLVKPGGILVYAVCSMEPEENEQVIDSFLHEHENFRVEKPNPLWPPWIKDLTDTRGFLRTFPHRHNMDGFFAARLKKQA